MEVVKRNELHTFVVLPKRWVVERSFGWLEKCRRLWKNCERKLNTSLQMVVLAFAVLILKYNVREFSVVNFNVRSANSHSRNKPSGSYPNSFCVR